MAPESSSDLIDVAYVVRVEALGEGEGRIRALDVTYERRGWQRTQRVNYGVKVTVEEGAEPLEPSPKEQRCMEEGNAKPLND